MLDLLSHLESRVVDLALKIPQGSLSEPILI